MTSITSKFKREFMLLIDLKEISGYIKKASQKLKTTLSLKQEEIEKLQEYKSSLINSCVTGKIKVN